MMREYFLSLLCLLLVSCSIPKAPDRTDEYQENLENARQHAVVADTADSKLMDLASTGLIQSRSLVLVSSRSNGQLSALPIKMGQQVRQGETLAQISGGQVITAPITGAVSEVLVNNHSYVTAGQPLCSIIDNQHLKVDFDVLESVLSRFKIGMHVLVTTSAYPHEQHQATVSAISPEISHNGMIHIEADISDNEHLKPGMTAIIWYDHPGVFHKVSAK